MTKKVDLTFTITLPDDHGGGILRTYPNGVFRIINSEGNEVIPTEIERTTHYERPKGKKIQSKAVTSGQHVSLNGLNELCALDHFIVIDTNSIEIGGTKISASFFLVLRLIKEAGGYRLVSVDNRGHVYEFHDVQSNPELLAIYRVANDTLKTIDPSQGRSIGFVTDTELDKHQKFVSGTLPIYGDNKLPAGFNLFYASSDTGQELLNKLIKFCDKEASKYLKIIQDDGIKPDGLMELSEDKAIKFHYKYISLEIESSFIPENTIEPIVPGRIEFS